MTTMTVGPITDTDRTDATATIHALQDAFNTNDPHALGALYTDHASWTNAAGTRLDGRTQITAFAEKAMTGPLADSRARYDVVKLLALSPDLIAANVHQTPVDTTGHPAPGPHGRALYILARTPHGWRIAAGQNTAIDPT
ncbi:SgcJ/EcaC family oxidoreductase [Nocardiopsis sp. NPDC057823]|uniref:SgcJ/EcaC family oxidoreductase n=1 Tax=Nocardiopsis sp. NPDC057823 TaxID=3346256 RepID=UPI003672A685